MVIGVVGLADLFNLLSGAILESHLSCGALLWLTKGPSSETKTQVNDFEMINAG